MVSRWKEKKGVRIFMQCVFPKSKIYALNYCVIGNRASCYLCYAINLCLSFSLYSQVITVRDRINDQWENSWEKEVTKKSIQSNKKTWYFRKITMDCNPRFCHSWALSLGKLLNLSIFFPVSVNMRLLNDLHIVCVQKVSSSLVRSSWS